MVSAIRADRGACAYTDFPAQRLKPLLSLISNRSAGSAAPPKGIQGQKAGMGGDGARGMLEMREAGAKAPSISEL
jgi:chemotaxis response regulator CheB